MTSPVVPVACDEKTHQILQQKDIGDFKFTFSANKTLFGRRITGINIKAEKISKLGKLSSFKENLTASDIQDPDLAKLHGHVYVDEKVIELLMKNDLWKEIFLEPIEKKNFLLILRATSQPLGIQYEVAKEKVEGGLVDEKYLCSLISNRLMNEERNKNISVTDLAAKAQAEIKKLKAE